VFGLLPNKLPASETYRIEVAPGSPLSQEHYLGWGLGSYSFNKYKKGKEEENCNATATVKNLSVGKDEQKKKALDSIVSGIFLGRDLINTPCSDLGPRDLAQAAVNLGKSFGASVEVIDDGEVLERDFPMVHAVGRAAAVGRDPLVVDLNWSGSNNQKKKPLVTLVGKGVCFDTGGLDIKPPSSMLTMKNDMGGAASVLALASMVMAANLDVRLRVLIPCVENCVASNAFRPSDVIKTRQGLTVEIGNTDAEGRLILADCLTLATEDPNEQPDILLDMATLTGAHRVALGWDLPGIFTDNEDLARDLYTKGLEHHDPVWRLPLWKPYAKMLDSRVADMNNIGSVPWGGAITAALFLQKFVNECPNWVHIDFNGWTRDKPGFPEGESHKRSEESSKC
jgi:leucyl aminopeptidase